MLGGVRRDVTLHSSKLGPVPSLRPRHPLLGREQGRLLVKLLWQPQPAQGQQLHLSTVPMGEGAMWAGMALPQLL